MAGTYLQRKISAFLTDAIDGVPICRISRLTKASRPAVLQLDPDLEPDGDFISQPQSDQHQAQDLPPLPITIILKDVTRHKRYEFSQRSHTNRRLNRTLLCLDNDRGSQQKSENSETAAPTDRLDIDGRRDKITRGDLLTPAHHHEIQKRRDIAQGLREEGFKVPEIPLTDPMARPTFQERIRNHDDHYGVKHGSPEDILPIGGLASGDLRPEPALVDPKEEEKPFVPISTFPKPSGREGTLNDNVKEEPCDDDLKPQLNVPGPQGNTAEVKPNKLPAEIGEREIPQSSTTTTTTSRPSVGPGSLGSGNADGAESPLNGSGEHGSCPSPEEIEKMVDRKVEQKLKALLKVSAAVNGPSTSDMTEALATTEPDEMTTDKSEETTKSETTEEEETTEEPTEEDTTDEVTETETTTEVIETEGDRTTTEFDTELVTEVIAVPRAPALPEPSLPISAVPRRLQAVFRKIIAPPLAPSFARLQNLVDNVAKTPLTDDMKEEENATAAELLPCLLRPGGCEVEDRSPSETKPASKGQAAVLKKTQTQIAKAVTKLQKDLDMRTAEVVKEIERRAAEMRREIAQEAEQVIEAVKYLVTILADSVTRADEMGAGFVREWFDDASQRYVGDTKAAKKTPLLDQDIQNWEADFKQQNKEAHKAMVEKLKDRVEKTRKKYGKPKTVKSLDEELGITEASEGPADITIPADEDNAKELLDSMPNKPVKRYGFIDA